MTKLTTTRPADQILELTPQVRIRVTRAPDALVVRAERRSPNSIDSNDWTSDPRGIVVPLDDVGLLTAALVAAARSA